MSQRYSQSRALWAITKASFTAIFAQPTSLFFSLVFPLIFILIFGAFGKDGPPTYKIALSANSDTSNTFYYALKNNPSIRFVSYPDAQQQETELAKGRITGVLTIRETKDSLGRSSFLVQTRSTTASSNTFGNFFHTLEYSKLKYESAVTGDRNKIVTIAAPEFEKTGRIYRSIDFVLPGQIGFSILFATLFGISFAFFSLREQLVLKRFYASPVNRINILVGIGMSRLFFQMMNVVVLILFGHFLLDFTLLHGVLTVIEMLLMTIIMLFLLMGVGLIFSSIAKSDTNIPLLVNLFGFPQMLLSGTFFPIDVFPKWLQEICRLLPLTQFNDAMRKISFEGLSIIDCWREIGILAIWMIVIYAIAVRVLKWE